MSHAAGHAEAAHGGGGGQHDEHADQQLAPAAHQDGNGKEDGGEKDELESAAHQGEPEAAGGLFEVDAGAQCDKSKRGGGGGKAGDSPLEDDRLRDTLVGLPLEREAVERAIAPLPLDRYFGGISIGPFVQALCE